MKQVKTTTLNGSPNFRKPWMADVPWPFAVADSTILHEIAKTSKLQQGVVQFLAFWMAMYSARPFSSRKLWTLKFTVLVRRKFPHISFDSPLASLLDSQDNAKYVLHPSKKTQKPLHPPSNHQ